MKRRVRNRDTRNETQNPLVVLAGLPNPICAAVAKAIEANLSPAPKTICVASGGNNQALYPERNVSELMNGVSDFAVRQLKMQPSKPSPKHIVLAYVPASDQERLLKEFDFFVFPVRLSRLADYNENGRQYRHHRQTAESYVVAALQVALVNFAELKRSLSSLSSKEPRLLPPINFEVSTTERMADLFIEMRRDTIPWTGPISKVRMVTVTHQEVEKHVPQGGLKRVFTDVRSLL